METEDEYSRLVSYTQYINSPHYMNSLWCDDMIGSVENDESVWETAIIKKSDADLLGDKLMELKKK